MNTNMTPGLGTITETAEKLSHQDTKVWFLFMTILTIGGLIAAVRYIAQRFETLMLKYSELQDARLASVNESHSKQDQANMRYVEKLEGMIKDNTSAKHELAVALKELNANFSRFQDGIKR